MEDIAMIYMNCRQEMYKYVLIFRTTLFVYEETYFILPTAQESQMIFAPERSSTS